MNVITTTAVGLLATFLLPGVSADGGGGGSAIDCLDEGDPVACIVEAIIDGVGCVGAWHLNPQVNLAALIGAGPGFGFDLQTLTAYAGIAIADGGQGPGIGGHSSFVFMGWTNDAGLCDADPATGESVSEYWFDPIWEELGPTELKDYVCSQVQRCP